MIKKGVISRFSAALRMTWVFSLIFFGTFCTQVASVDVCGPEIFDSGCATGEVIFMQMRNKRCINMTKDGTWCYSEVLVQSKVLPSTTAGKVLAQTASNCLEISYRCTNETRCPESDAPWDAFIKLSSKEYHLSCHYNGQTGWKVQCINGTWISDNPVNCTVSPVSTSTEVRYPDATTTDLVTPGNIKGTAPAATVPAEDEFPWFVIAVSFAGLVVVSLAVAVAAVTACTGKKRRERRRRPASECYATIDENYYKEPPGKSTGTKEEPESWKIINRYEQDPLSALSSKESRGPLPVPDSADYIDLQSTEYARGGSQTRGRDQRTGGAPATGRGPVPDPADYIELQSTEYARGGSQNRGRDQATGGAPPATGGGINVTVNVRIDGDTRPYR